LNMSGISSKLLGLKVRATTDIYPRL
jgi:hypothetical protein